MKLDRLHRLTPSRPPIQRPEWSPAITLDIARLAELLDAPTHHSLHFLDLETGRIIRPAPGEAIPGAHEKYDVQDERYIAITPWGQTEALNIREQFLLTAPILTRSLLRSALDSRKPLRTFDRAVMEHIDLRPLWQAFLTEEVKLWLAQHDLEPAPL